VTLLSLQLERMVNGVSMVLVQALENTAKLGIRQQRLGNRRRTSDGSHLRSPPVVRGSNSKQRLPVRCELNIQFGGVTAIGAGSGRTGRAAGVNRGCVRFESLNVRGKGIQHIDRLQA